MLSPMIGSPISDVGQGGILEPVDLNNDGRDDLAIGSATATTGGVRIRIANPDGSWTAGQTILGGSAIGEITSADFNADGKQDLLVVAPSQTDPLNNSDQYRVFRGNGNGTFQTAQMITVPGDKVAVTTPTGQSALPLDLNSDGNLDLVLALSRGQLGVAAGNGDGTFDPLIVAPLPDAPAGAREGFSTVVSGDFNGDGLLDLVLGLRGDSQGTSTSANTGIFVLFRTSASSFEGAAHVPMPEPYGGIRRMLVVDLDRDGIDDLVVRSASANGSGPASDFAFEGTESGFSGDSAVLLGSFEQSSPTLLGDDFNGDGLLDLAWSESSAATPPSATNLVLSLQEPDGGFLPQSRSFPLHFSGSQDVPAAIETGDFNGDGATDVATGFRSSDCNLNPCGVSVLINQPTVELDNDSLDFGTVSKGSVQTGKTFTITNHGGAPANLATFVISGNEPAAFSLKDQCGIIAPGASCSPTVDFSTGKAGTYTATLIYTFAGVTGDFKVKASGSVVNYHGTFSTSQIDFSEILIGSDFPTRTVTVAADGESGLTVGRLSLGGPNPEAFKLESDNCSGQSLTSGSTCSFTIGTALTSAGPSSALVNIPSNGIGMATSIPVAATGISPVYTASLKLTGPKKARAGKKFKLISAVTNTGTGELSGVQLKYTATQNKAVKAKGTFTLPVIGVGKKLSRPVPIAIKKAKLKRGKPVVVTVNVTLDGKTLASKGFTVRQEFGPATAVRK